MNRRMKADAEEVYGTSLMGYIEASYAKIVSIFGIPDDGDGYKVDAKWGIKLTSGHIATIYNYKDGKNYNGEEGTDVELITDWHIGGNVREVVKEIAVG